MNVGEIIDFCGGFKAEPGKIITGGPMMGLAVVNTDIPVLKQNNAILAFADDASKVKKERDCIRCGRCAAACPLSLMPTLVERYIKAKDIDRLEKSGAWSAWSAAHALIHVLRQSRSSSICALQNRC